MSGSTTAQIAGASTAAVGGAALLPNTHGKVAIMTVLALVILSVTLVSLIASRIYKKTL